MAEFMRKPAETQFPVHEFIRERWSPLAFSDRPVEPEKIGSLLEAARWSASSFNEQPWRYFVATKDRPQAYAALLDLLVEFNRAWAQRAPLLMLAVAKQSFTRNDADNRHAAHDVGLANQSIVFQAMSDGLVVRQMAGFDHERARSVLTIPDGFEPLTMLVIGYPGATNDLDEGSRQRELAPRSRRPLDELIFTNQWGHPFSFGE